MSRCSRSIGCRSRVTGNGRSRINGEFGIDGGRLLEAASPERRDALFTAGRTDPRGKPIAGSPPPTEPDVPPTNPTVPYEPPLRSRFDWNRIGLGWTHPDELRRRRSRWRTPHDESEHAG